jgi:hypothetical protein
MNSRDEEELDVVETVSYYIGSTIIVPTENGYFKALKAGSTESFKIKLIKRNISSITFSPMESGELVLITTVNGKNVESIYTIKENV